MNTNIRTSLALHRIRRFSLDIDDHLTVPPVVLVDALRLLMKNNAFQFGDKYWLQKAGTLMGAPPAPSWATVFFGIHEKAVIAQFRDSLQLYCCFIDNVLGIWLVDTNPTKDHRKWMAFKSLMQDYYGLEWIFEERLETVNNMEMMI